MAEQNFKLTCYHFLVSLTVKLTETLLALQVWRLHDNLYFLETNFNAMVSQAGILSWTSWVRRLKPYQIFHQAGQIKVSLGLFFRVLSYPRTNLKIIDRISLVAMRLSTSYVQNLKILNFRFICSINHKIKVLIG